MALPYAYGNTAYFTEPILLHRYVFVLKKVAHGNMKTSPGASVHHTSRAHVADRARISSRALVEKLSCHVIRTPTRRYQVGDDDSPASVGIVQ